MYLSQTHLLTSISCQKKGKNERSLCSVKLRRNSIEFGSDWSKVKVNFMFEFMIFVPSSKKADILLCKWLV